MRSPRQAAKTSAAKSRPSRNGIKEERTSKRKPRDEKTESSDEESPPPTRRRSTRGTPNNKHEDKHLPKKRKVEVSTKAKPTSSQKKKQESESDTDESEAPVAARGPRQKVTKKVRNLKKSQRDSSSDSDTIEEVEPSKLNNSKAKKVPRELQNLVNDPVKSLYDKPTRRSSGRHASKDDQSKSVKTSTEKSKAGKSKRKNYKDDESDSSVEEVESSEDDDEILIMTPKRKTPVKSSSRNKTRNKSIIECDDSSDEDDEDEIDSEEEARDEMLVNMSAQIGNLRKLLNTKEAEIRRLKNELKEKNESLEGMEETMLKNMMLESEVQKLQFTHQMKKATTRDTGVGTSDADFPTAMPPPPSIMLKPTRTQQEIEADKKRQAEVDRVTAERAELAKKANVISITAQPMHRPNILSNTLAGATRYTYTTQPVNPQIYPRPAPLSTTTLGYQGNQLGYQGNQHSNPQSQVQTQTMIDNIMKELYPGGATVAQPNNLTLNGSAVTAQSTVKPPTSGPTPAPEVKKPISKKAENDDDDCVDITDDVIDKEIEDEMTSTSGEESDSDDEDTDESGEEESDESEDEDSEEDEDESEDEEDNDESPDEEKDEENKSKSTKNKKTAADDIIALSDNDDTNGDEKPKSRKKLNMDIDVVKTPERRTSRRGMSQSESEKSPSKAPSTKQGQSKTDKSKNQTPRKTRTKSQSDTESEASSNIKTESETKGKTDTKDKKVAKSKDKPSKEDSKVETKPPTRRSLRGEAQEVKENEKSTRSTRSKLDKKDSKANIKDIAESDEEKTTSKKKTRGTKKKELSSESEEDEKEDAPVKKKTRGTKSKDLASDSDDESDESEEKSTTTKRVTRGGKKNDAVKGKATKDRAKSVKDVSEDEMEEDENSQRPTRASKRKLNPDEDKAGPVKKSKRGKGNKDSSDEDEEEETTKGKKGKKQTKKTKKKGKGKKGKKDDTESDAYEDISYEDSEEEEKDAKMRKKKRKKKKKDEKSGKKKKGKGKKGKTKETTDEESDEDDGEKDGTPHGRRNIKRILGKKKLSKKTVRAEKEEEERRERVKKLNEKFKKRTVIDPKSPTKCPITTKLVLESHSKTNRSIIKVNSNLITKLKPHQVEAVEFLWDCIVENLKTMRSSTGSGAILAHCMGLGKTLSSISLVHTLLSHQNLTKMKTCLVVCPLNTILNWENEWEKWFDEEDQLDVYELATAKDNKERGIRLRKWTKNGGVMVMGYSLFRILAMSNTKSKALKKTFEESLINPGPDLVVCDEGHILKNEASAISQCMNNIRTRRRIVLTGTPLQNNLIEYHCMVNFVKPNLLGTTREFKNRFVNPIINGQCVDSTPRDHKIMKRRAHVLHEMLVGCVQRRDYSALTKFLPPKHEYVISVRLSEAQIKLYEEYLRIHLNMGPDGKIISHGARLFSDYQELMRIWTHPWVLQLNEVIREKIRQKELDEESVDSFDEDEEDEVTSDQSATSSESISSSEESDDSEDQTSKRKRSRKAKLKPRQDDDARDIIHGERVRGWRNTRLNKEKKSDDEIEELREKPPPPWWEKFVKEDDEYKMELSGKLMLMFEIVKLAGAMGDKVLVFSQSLLSLDLIESFLEHMHNQAEEKNKKKKKTPAMNMEKWEKGKDYYRFDGSTNAKLRKKYQQEFSKNKRARLFLISTKAGSLGINLDKANRVIIFDASWNPSHDVQSIFRVYRFGQVKDVFVYRFLAQGTMEEKIYERQIEKLSLSQRVIDEHQIERHFNSNDLKELYNFQPDRLEDKKERPTPKLPKDVILTEILKSRKDHIVSYQEHDSLLEHLVEEELNEDERKAAWEEYENEKKGMMRYGGFGAIGQNLASGNSAFGLQQLPRVVQEILKYNPNIPPQELQTRLQAFLKLQTPQQGLSLQQRPVQSSAFPGGNYLRGPQTQGVAIQPRPSYATTTIPNPNLIGNPLVRIGQPAVYNPTNQNIIRVNQSSLPSRLPGVGTIPGLGAGPMNVIRVNANNGTVQVNGASK